MFKWYAKLQAKLYSYLVYEPSLDEVVPLDYKRLRQEIRPGDVILIEGRSRISKMIRSITQSPWTHAALYIGKLADFESGKVRELVRERFPDAKENSRLIVEDLLDKGTVITKLRFYQHHHIRICRPIGITEEDVNTVIQYMVKSLGQPYNVRQVFDLFRFLLPWRILPRQWGSSLFYKSTGEPESGICSTRIASAFATVQFPVLPYIKPTEQKGVSVYARNPYLFTPKDFDFSPYFDIIKYPLLELEETKPYYRRIPWSEDGMMYHDNGILSRPKSKTKA